MDVVAAQRQSPRKRAPVRNGYKKTTITVPSTTFKAFERHLKQNPGLSMSAFLTEAGEHLLESK